VRAAAFAFLATATLLGPATAARAEAGPTVGGPALATSKVVAGRGGPAVPHVTAAGWVVADVDTGEVLAARNPHGRYLPASTLKTLTAVSVLPLLDLRKRYVASHADVNIEGSRVGLVEGMRYPIGTLVESMLVVSGNDAANAVASAAGGATRTVATMNATAQRLQAYDTLARNPSGLDAPGQLTSAYDLALIARAGLAMPKFAQYAATLRDTVPAPGGRRFEIYNHNKLLTKYQGDIGIKTGYTIAARHTYVGAARRNGHTIVVTLMRSESLYPDATALLDWGFSAVGRTVAVGRLVDPVPPDAGTRADRSRTTTNAAPAAAPRIAKVARSGGRVPTVPATGAALGIGGLLVLRRRQVRRRYRVRGSAPRLRLPVR
jgi:D-alanyl-D-alanine carboxypeptidase (penicillin-binding protein 5/6)